MGSMDGYEKGDEKKSEINMWDVLNIVMKMAEQKMNTKGMN